MSPRLHQCKRIIFYHTLAHQKDHYCGLLVHKEDDHGNTHKNPFDYLGEHNLNWINSINPYIEGRNTMIKLNPNVILTN